MKKNVWGRLLSFSGKYKRNFILMLVLIICTGAIEGSFPFLSGWLIDNIIYTGDIDKLGLIAAIFAVVIVSIVLSIYWFIHHTGTVENGMAYEIRKACFNKLQKLSLSFYDTNSAGTTLSKLTSDVNRVCGTIAWGIIDITWGIVMMFTMTILMFVRNWYLALVTLAVMPVLFIGAFIFQKIIIEKYREVRKVNGIITGAYNEGIMGARTLKTLVLEDKSLNEFKEKTSLMRNKAIKAGIIGGIFFPFISLMASIGTSLSLWNGGMLVADSIVTYGVFASFIFASMQFFNPVYDMSRTFANLQYARAAGERILDLLDSEEDIVDQHDVDHNVDVQGAVEFKDVTFSYNTGEVILENFSLSINKGESVALVGETGSGKSTIVNLACRFYEPTKGVIEIDGRDYTTISQKSLHSRLGYVLQSPYLFNDTVFENIRYGKLDATEDEIIEACKAIEADKFINGLENGYNTVVGESGKLLSTGQKQLLSLARAVLADPAIFVLDEATSSVDTETEKLIQAATDKLMHGRTSFVIAHRLSTIVNADTILVIEKGKIIERGTHKELMNNRGYYYTLFTNQFMDEAMS